jgi:hypothetical protein
LPFFSFLYTYTIKIIKKNLNCSKKVGFFLADEKVGFRQKKKLNHGTTTPQTKIHSILSFSTFYLSLGFSSPSGRVGDS